MVWLLLLPVESGSEPGGRGDIAPLPPFVAGPLPATAALVPAADAPAWSPPSDEPVPWLGPAEMSPLQPASNAMPTIKTTRA
jgi:hypothetical protein